MAFPGFPPGLRRALELVRGSTALVMVLAWLAIPGAMGLFLVVAPAGFVCPRHRVAWASVYLRHVSRVVLALFALGGASSRRSGLVPTQGPGLVVMNHQSLLDVPVATLMSHPVAPAFVARARYTRVPLVATALDLLGCPLLGPQEDAQAALRHAVQQDRTFLIFPEGHRTRDGELQPFRTAGLLAMLEQRRVPVWLIVTDGFWAGRSLWDLAARTREVRGETEVVGPIEPPADAAALPEFVAALEARMTERLADLRARRAGPLRPG